jgi:spore maturation protein SpmB
VMIISGLLAAMPSLAKPVMVLIGIPIQLAIIMLPTAMQTTLYGYFAENREL